MPVVTVQMAAGRSPEQKRRIVEDFTATLVAVLKVDPADVTIFVQELPRDHIGRGGVLLSER